MEYPQGISKRWTVTRELSNVTHQEIGTMMQKACQEMRQNGLDVDYMSVYIDAEAEQYTRVVVLLRLDQQVTDRTVFYWLAHDRAVVKSLTFEGLKRAKRTMRRNNKECIFKWNDILGEQMDTVDTSVDNDW